MATNKGFIKDWLGQTILPITRGELVLDSEGKAAFASEHFLAKDGHPGLVTAAEREMLLGSGSGGGISDLYNKIDYINNGLVFNGTTLNFYDESGTATPIKIVSPGDNKIDIIPGNNNTVILGLSEIATAETSVTQLLRSITVDKYGRVTSVSGTTLTSNDIPTNLISKNLVNGVLDNCITSDAEIGTNDKAIVNKAYVDSKFREVTGIATGALKFGGTISDANTAEAFLLDVNKRNTYYKVSGSFDIKTANLFDTSGITGNTLTVSVGDTLIVYASSIYDSASKFVYIPSGDDITTITVTEDDAAADTLYRKTGNVTLKFSKLFSVSNNPSGSNTAYITIPKANRTTDGYLSAEDYLSFKNLATELLVEYKGEFTSGLGVYKIGTLTIGGSDNDIYGRYNISGLSINDSSTTGSNKEYNPILKFTETGAVDVDIALKGIGGIRVRKSGNDVEFMAANEVIAQPSPLDGTKLITYLTIEDGYKFGVKLGSADASGKVL